VASASAEPSAFTTPDSLDSVLANPPVRTLQQRRDAPVTIAAILAGKLDDGLRESSFVFSLCRLIALRAAWLVHQLARPSLTQALLLSRINRNTPTLRA